LLTYHRAKGKREQKCPQCKDELEKAVQTCYWCGRKFSDADGMIADQSEVVADLEAMFGGTATDEQKAEAYRRQAKAAREQGALALKDPIPVDDWKAFKAKHFGK